MHKDKGKVSSPYYFCINDEIFSGFISCHGKVCLLGSDLKMLDQVLSQKVDFIRSNLIKYLQIKFLID